MEFGKISNMTVGQVAKNVAAEGGSVVAGLLGAGVIGKQIEKHVGTAGSKAALPTSTMTDKLIAYVANNAPKLGMWYLLKKEGKSVLGAYTEDVEKGIVASLALDTVMRISNSGAPKVGINLWGYDVMGDGTPASNVTSQMQQNMQKVLQENSSLRQQLNGALQRVASANTSPAPIVTVTPIQAARPIQTIQPQQTYAPHNPVNYGTMPPVSRGNPKYGNMEVPTTPSQKKYGQMNNLEVGVSSLGALYEMD